MSSAAAAANTSLWSDLGVFLQFAPPAASMQPDTPGTAVRPVVKSKPLSPQDAALQDAKERLKESLREIRSELRHMKRDEAKRIRQVKERAERGEMERGRDEARKLVLTRKAILRVEQGCDRLSMLDQKMQLMRTNVAIVKYTERAVAVMKSLNANSMEPSRVAELARDMELQNETLKMNMELVNETLDTAFEDDADEDAELGDEFSDTVVFDQICAECGIAQAASMPSVPSSASATAQTSAGTMNDGRIAAPVAMSEGAPSNGGAAPTDADAPDATQHEDDELMDRLARLRDFKK